MRLLHLLGLALLLPACFESESDACALAEESSTCPECYSGDATCTFDGTEATEASCDDCQARSALYAQLCDDGSEATREEIEDGTTCVSEGLPDTG